MFVYTAGHHLYVYKYNADKPSTDLQFLAHSEFEDLQADESGVFIVSMEYVQELQAVVLAFNNGEIYFFEPGTKQVKDAGVLDGSILAASWSPNEEYYIVASGNG